MFGHLNLQAFSNSQCQSQAFKWPRLAETNSGVAPDRVREFMQAPDSMRTWTASKWPFSAAICLSIQKAISGHKMQHHNTHNARTGLFLNRQKKCKTKMRQWPLGLLFLSKRQRCVLVLIYPFFVSTSFCEYPNCSRIPIGCNQEEWSFLPFICSIFVRFGFKKQPHDLQVAILCGPKQWCKASVVRSISICTRMHQTTGHFQLVACCSCSQGRLPMHILKPMQLWGTICIEHFIIRGICGNATQC